VLNLSDIIGQEEAVARLRRALAGSRAPHAWLFAGPDGVGRRTTALALAATLLCERPVPSEGEVPAACGQCPGCRMLEAGTHPDFHLVYKELAAYHDDPDVRKRVMQELSIDVIRQFLILPATRSSARGRGKVFVVLEADVMSDASQNALLKTLEEPPAGTTIILLCERPEQLLPTTRSRCATVRFGPLPRPFVERRLIEGGLAAEEARFWAAHTDGSLGRAMSLSAGGLYAVKRELVARLASAGPTGDADLGERLVAAAGDLAKQAVAETKDSDDVALSQTLATRRAASILLELLAGVFHDALIRATGANVPPTHADQAGEIGALASRFTPSQLADILRQLSTYEELLWRNVNPKTIWDNAAIAVSTAAPLRL